MDLTVAMESGDTTVESDAFDKVVTLDSQSKLASPNHLTDDISDDIEEAISIMLTGDELAPGESQ